MTHQNIHDTGQMSIIDHLSNIPFSDIVVEVRGKSYNCHRLILWQLPFFRPMIVSDPMFALEPLDFNVEAWEVILCYLYSQLYPEMECKYVTGDVVVCCLLADYLGVPDIAKKHYHMSSNLKFDQLVQLQKIPIIHSEVIDEIFKCRFNLDDYPELYEDTMKKLISGDNISVHMSSSEERDTLHAITDYRLGRSHLIVKAWDKIPDEYKVDIASLLPKKPSPFLVEYLITHAPEKVTAPHLLNSGIWYRAVDLLPERDLRIEIALSLRQNGRWGSYLDSHFISDSQTKKEARLVWFLYSILRYHKKPNVRKYIDETIIPYLSDDHPQYSGRGRNCIDELRSRYYKLDK